MTAVPTTFGKYYLTEKVATGGMAEIYLAKLIGPGGFEKQLIIKQILPQFSRQRQFLDLFVAEAKTLCSLSHGNIVPIYELGVVEETYFIAMEFIDGATLDMLLRALREQGEIMDPRMAAYIASELLKGLDYAHRKADGVIHRDLSPRNVMLSREGEVRIVDFGLAVTVEGKQLSSGAGGRPVGSFPYMSPEQVRREQLDGRTDIFSAGVLLWEMLAGRALFARTGEDETLGAVLEAPIAKPSEINAEAPAQLDHVCLKALVRDREGRYQSAGEFLADVGRYLYSHEELISPEDLSRLLARTCPPTTAERAAARAGDETEPPPGEDAGLYTRPMEGRAAGKQRQPAVQTFATNLQFEEELANAAPEAPPPERPGRETGAAGETRRPRRASPHRFWPLLAAVGAVAALAGVAFAVWPSQSGPATARSGDAAASSLSAPASDAALADAAEIPPADALVPSAAADTGVISIDAAPAGQQTARARPDARPRPRGTGTLRVGASPWADVFVDGKKVGQAPGSFTVAAGPHVVVLRYKGEETSLRVTISPDQTHSLGLIEFRAEP